MSKRKNKRQIHYIKTIAALDIESTSAMIDGEKKAWAYNWHVQVEDEHHNFRHVEEFVEWLDMYATFVGSHEHNRLVVWVHNLGYEFQFLKFYLSWTPDVFANGTRTNVIRALTDNGIEFRCSLSLTNQPLAKVGEEVGIEKMMGDLDYDLIRHPETPLTDEEMKYIEHDTEIIIALIRKRLEKDTLKTIPMTLTGYVRRLASKTVLKDKKYKFLINKLTMEHDEYILARMAYKGGYVAANASYVGTKVQDVIGYDLASSYPSQMVAFTYPMSKGVDVTEIVQQDIDLFHHYMDTHHLLMNVTITNFHSKYPFNTESEHKADELINPIINNGRVVQAESMTTSMTDVDLHMFQELHEYENIFINECWAYKADYLPTPLVEFVLELYKDKTELKDVEGAEERYVEAKVNINSVYGMVVTDPIKPDVAFDPSSCRVGIRKDIPDAEEKLDKHNDSHKRFLFYPWGVWITAYARQAILKAMKKLHDEGIKDYYCDTDSRYVEDTPQTRDIFTELNVDITSRINDALKHHGLDPSLGAPKSKDGIAFPIGVWEEDGKYVEFKTLGAKRYAGIKENGTFAITISGVNKRKGAEYIESIGGLDAFDHDLYIPRENSGKNTAEYSDGVMSGMVTDYMGLTSDVWQKGFVHIETTDYNLSLSEEHREWVKRVTGLDFGSNIHEILGLTEYL